MILSEKVFTKLQSLLASIPAWEDLANSQFVKHLAIFVGWAVEDASFKVERAHQEAFIGTALNRSSIIAHAEDREYMPRKPKPSTGEALFANSGDASVILLRGKQFYSESRTPYVLDSTVIVPPKGTIVASITQKGRELIEHTVTDSMAYYEILLGRDLTPKVMNITVSVQENENAQPEKWVYSRLLANAYDGSKVWDEFYHYTDQIGVRFGNGTFGAIPPQGSIVRIEMETTEGDAMLLKRQYLYPLEEIKDEVGSIANIQAEVATTVQGGQSHEPTEEIRRNLHYWPVYNERLIWDNDYEYFLRRRFPEIVFTRAWGEEEAESLWGKNVDHINKIWICAYAPRDGMQADVMKAIADVPMMCRNFKWYEPEHVEFRLDIKGCVLSDRLLSEVRDEVVKALYAAYGKDSSARRDKVLISEIYECIYATGHFEKSTGAWFEAVPSGTFAADKIYQMVSLDIENSSFELSYAR